MAYFNPQRYEKSLAYEDKVHLLYKLVLAALISANGAEETLKIMERLGASQICDITEIKKVFIQVKDALGIAKTNDEGVMEQAAEIQPVIDKAVHELGG